MVSEVISSLFVKAYLYIGLGVPYKTSYNSHIKILVQAWCDRVTIEYDAGLPAAPSHSEKAHVILPVVCLSNCTRNDKR